MSRQFKVGDRVRIKHGERPDNCFNGPFDQPVTVTEITRTGGFKWKTDKPLSLGARYGTFTEGECYMPDLYELEREAQE